MAANKGLTLTFFANRETLLCPSTCPCPDNCEYQRKTHKLHPTKYHMVEFTRYALHRSAFYCETLDSSFVQTEVIIHKSLPQHGCKIVLHFHSFSPVSLISSFQHFSFHRYVSYVYISKYPTRLDLWGTIRTATSPTTTTGWEGVRAPTAGQRYEYSHRRNLVKEERWPSPRGPRSSQLSPRKPGSQVKALSTWLELAGVQPSRTGFGHLNMSG